MPVKPRPWRSYKYTHEEFKRLLGIDPKDDNLEILVFPNRIEVTAEYKDSGVTPTTAPVKRVHGDLYC